MQSTAASSLRRSTLSRRLPMSQFARMALALPFACALAFAPGDSKAEAPAVFRDTSQTPEARARDLVSRMTLAEKAGQMRDTAPAIERLGLKRYGWWNEVLHGVARAGNPLFSRRRSASRRPGIRR